jgi:TP901 family phage tail tape measure protein
LADRKINIRVSTTGTREVQGLAGVFGALGAAIPLVTIALGALTIAAVKAAKEFIKFESKLADIKTLATDTSYTLDDFKEQLLGIKKEVPLAELNDLTDAMYKYISATGDVEGAEKAITNISKAAIGNQADVASTTDMLARTMKNFQKDASDAEDIMNKFSATITNANSTGEEFAAVAGDMSAAANFAGLSMEDMMAAYAAGTQTLNPRRVAFGFQSLTANIVDNRKEFEKWGVSTTNLNDTLADLVRLQGEMSKTEYQDMVRKLVPDMRGMKLLNALVANYDGFKQSLDEINNSEGLMAEKFAVKMDTAEAKIEAMNAAFEDFGLRAGELFTEIGEAFIDAFGETDVEDFLNGILEVIESLVPLLKQIAELLGTGVSTSVKTIAEDLSTIADLIKWINGLFGETDKTADDVGKKSIELSRILHVVLEIIKLIPTYIENISAAFKGQISIVEALSKNLHVWVDTLKVGFGLAEKTTAELEKQSRMQERAVEHYEDIVNRYKEWGESGQLQSQLERGLISEEEFNKVPPGAVDYALGVGFITQADIDKARSQWKGGTVGETGGGIGGDLSDPTKEGDDKHKQRYEQSHKARIADELELQAIQKNGLTESELLRKKWQDDREEAEKETVDRIVTNARDALTRAIMGQRDAIKALFGTYLQNTVQTALSAAFSLVRGGGLGITGGFLGFLGAIFGAKGFTEKSGKVLQLAYGGAFGKGVHKLSQATPAIIGEGRSNEIAAAIPLDMNGVRITAGSIIPELEKATGVKFGGNGGNVQIHITERASQWVDIQTAQSNIRGQRIMNNDIGN